jgi:hypothetical protein
MFTWRSMFIESIRSQVHVFYPHTSSSFLVLELIYCVPPLNSWNGQTLSRSCCAEGRETASINLLCGACQSGYSRWNNKCVACAETNGGKVFGLILLLWLYILGFHRISQASTAETRITLNYIQMVLLLFGPDAPWLAWLAVFDFNVFQASGLCFHSSIGFFLLNSIVHYFLSDQSCIIIGDSCVMPTSSLQKLAAGVYLPLIGFGMLWTTAGIHALIVWLCRRYPDHLHQQIHTLFAQWRHEPYLRTTLALIVWSYNSIVGSVLRFFSCQTVGTLSILPDYPDVDCRSSSYQELKIAYILLAAIVVAGVPIALLVLTITLYRRRLLSRDGPFYKTVRSKFGVLYENYTLNRFYW